jgi:hypothetical protein
VPAIGDKFKPADDLIPLTVNEVRHLLINLALPTGTAGRLLLTWSRWRRRHQARAQASHHHRQAAALQLTDHKLGLEYYPVLFLVGVPLLATAGT